jgi:GNAT superfamily N-acetyltransferase
VAEHRNQVRELAGAETHLAYVAMLELRPHIGSSSDFVRTVDETQRPQGYRLIASFDEDEQAAAAAGFRVIDYLAWGHALYCDDLSTRQMYRGRGHAGLLVDWMIGEAKRLGCGEFHLDSGVGPDRTTAHRLYFNKGMRISSHHFSRPV